MKQKETMLIKKKCKEKNQFIFKETKLDIYAIKDENGISLGNHIENLYKEIEYFRKQVEIEQQKRKDFVKAFKGANK